jgi:hypothetical protein
MMQTTWTSDRDLGTWFDDIVRDAVQQRLSRPDICFATLEPGVKGKYLNDIETQTGRPAILISSSRRLHGPLFIYDTLVHEVAHHAVYELCRPDSSGHGPIFCNVANTMAERLGYQGRIQPETLRALHWPGSLAGR